MEPEKRIEGDKDEEWCEKQRSKKAWFALCDKEQNYPKDIWLYTFAPESKELKRTWSIFGESRNWGSAADAHESTTWMYNFCGPETMRSISFFNIVELLYFAELRNLLRKYAASRP